MGTSFVAIGKRGFWMRDGTLGLWLRFLALHIEHPPTSGFSPASATKISLAARIRDQWLLASEFHFGGCVPDGLEEFVSTEDGAGLVRDAIHSLMRALSVAPPHLSKDVVNLMGFPDPPFISDLETRRLAEIGQAFLDLLDGKIQSDASSTSFMPGS